MLNAFDGRINRKMFILGNIVGLGMLGGVAFVFLVPTALIDIILNNAVSSALYRLTFYLMLFPAAIYYFYFVTLLVKRFHDLGYPGLIWVIIFTFGLGVGKISGFWILNAFCLLIPLALCILPGQKSRNNFGAKPHKSFKVAQLIPKV